eukprot:898521-Prymnesium_polylepis.1
MAPKPATSEDFQGRRGEGHRHAHRRGVCAGAGARVLAKAPGQRAHRGPGRLRRALGRPAAHRPAVH